MKKSISDYVEEYRNIINFDSDFLLQYQVQEIKKSQVERLNEEFERDYPDYDDFPAFDYSVYLYEKNNDDDNVHYHIVERCKCLNFYF